MNRILLVAVLFISISPQIQAQSKKESIKKLFGLMQQDSLVSKSFEIMTSSMVSSMATKMESDTALSSRISKIMAKSLEASKKIAMKLINEDMVDIYDKYFSQQEIDDFIVFYKSAAGQKMIHVLPDIQKDIMAVMSAKYTPTLQEEIARELEQVIREATGQN